MTAHPFPTLVEVTVYSKPGCPQCLITTKNLDRLGLAYQYRDVTVDGTARAAVESLGYRSLPVVTAGDMHWSGFRADKLKWLAEIHGINADIGPLDAVAEDYLSCWAETIRRAIPTEGNRNA